MDRFPEDFMFELSEAEFANWRSQYVTSKSLKMGLRYKPFAFTEHGVLMLSSVLRSSQAIEVNIQIMRVYSKLKDLLSNNQQILLKLVKLERSSGRHEEDIKKIFAVIKKLIENPKQEKTSRIGFKKDW